MKFSQNIFSKFLPEKLRNHLISNIVTIQGYFHSDDSPSAKFGLSNCNISDDTKLNFEISKNSSINIRVNRLIKKLYNSRQFLGIIPIRPLLKIGVFGEGYHVGSVFPMSQNPQKHSSDNLGRINGFKNLHMIDASILPSIPSTTITFTVMANAYRIAEESS